MNRGLLPAWGLSIVTACATSSPAEKPAPEPRVRVSRLFPKPDSLRASKIAVTLELQNPRATPLTVSGIDYEIDSGDVSGVLRGQVEGGAVLDGEQIAELEFTSVIPFPEEQERFMAVLERGTLPLLIKGVVTFDEGPSVSFERNGAVATPSFPTFVVHDAQAARYGEEGVDVTFFLRLVNENPFAVTIGDVQYAITIEGREAKSEQGAIGVRLTQGAAQEFEVGITIDEATFGDVKAVLRSGIVRYAVTGRVSVGPYEQPYVHEGQIVLAGGS